MKKNLLETININGREYNAEILGEDLGLKVVDVQDWEAANAIQVFNSHETAGNLWMHNESTFNEHVGGQNTLRFYVFLHAPDNKALAAAIAPLNSFHNNGHLIAKINLSDREGAENILVDNLPLRFIPNLEYKGENGLLFNSDLTKIVSNYNGLYPSDETIESYTVPENITQIGTDAFNNYNYAQNVIIGENVTSIEANAFNNYRGNICCMMEHTPEGWHEHWMGDNSHIIWNYGRDPEEIERNRIAREEAARAAAEANDRECQEKFGVDWNTLVDYLNRNGDLITDENEHAVMYGDTEIYNPGLDTIGKDELRSLAEIYRVWVEQEGTFSEEELNTYIRNVVTLFNEHPHLEDEIQAEKERIEQERQEAERRRQELQNAETVSVLKYRQVGNGITIFGCKKGREKLDIPAEINGKPVTKIAPFAFYDNKTLVDVLLPDTIEEIGKGAFADTIAVVHYPKAATVYSDAFLNNDNTVKY